MSKDIKDILPVSPFVNNEHNMTEKLHDLFMQTSYVEPCFIGRLSERTHLRKLLSSVHDTVCVQITGSAGIGKTVLAHQYAHSAKNNYKSIIKLSPHDIGNNMIIGENSLVIIDDAETIRGEIWARLRQNLREPFHLIVTSRTQLHDPIPHKTKVIELNSLNQFESMEIIQHFCNDISLSPYLFSNFPNEIKGNPFLLTLLAKIVKKNGFDYVENVLYKNANDLYLPQNKVKVESFEKVKVATASVNNSLLSVILKTPSLMREISPREFERLIADLYRELGFEVELTKQTRDGGKDLYVLSRTDIGSFLYLVECKRYAPNKPVGVEIIRNLYGVMGMSKRKANAGIVVTTSHFTKDAKNEILSSNLEHQIQLQDYDYICSLLDKIR
ncbi:MAG: restriction endonuclease [Oscillospiraceae bacterium]|jgi:restriction system protein|nr:restriction endonuclease [Oscillospiraceae bacterium]